MDEWTWQYEAAGGPAVPSAALAAGSFPSQADAESWVGESWRDLLAQGVESVSLLHDGVLVYGPMSLRPVE
jgi:hypothetical protein